MLYFLKKAEKIATTLGAPPPNSFGLRRLEAPPLDSQVVILTLVKTLNMAQVRFMIGPYLVQAW